MNETPVYFRIDRPEVVHGASVFADQVIVSAFYFALQYFVLKKKECSRGWSLTCFLWRHEFKSTRAEIQTPKLDRMGRGLSRSSIRQPADWPIQWADLGGSSLAH